MTQHTPGPWELLPQSDGSNMVALRRETGKQMNPYAFRLVCHVLARGDSIKQDDANAKLIAAAPDLLVACQRVLTHDSVDLCDCGEPECATTLLRAAIDKATA